MSEAIFNVAVKAVIEKEGKVLMLYRSGGAGFREGPGGRIVGDDSIDKTLNRELDEELPGIENIRPGRLLHAERMPGLLLGDKGLFLVWYQVEADFPQGVLLSDEHESYKWCTRDEAMSIAQSGMREAIGRL